MWGRCRRRTCPGFAPLWANDWRHLLMMNLLQLDGVALVTITAPGRDERLAWDRSKCRHPAAVRCSGKLGCRVVQEIADRWNADCEGRLSKLHRAAPQIARRRHGPGSLVAAKTWEEQSRGLQHAHMVVPFSTPQEKARARTYVAALKELAPKEWFGFVDLRQRFNGDDGGIRAALYCAKYVGKAAGAETAVRRPVFIGRFLTMQSGLTMRLLRWRRYIFWLWGFRPGADELRPLVELLQAFPNLKYVGTTVQPSGP